MSDIRYMGTEQTLDTGISDQELRCVALQAAARVWSAVEVTGHPSGRTGAVMDTADIFLGWLKAVPDEETP